MIKSFVFSLLVVLLPLHSDRYTMDQSCYKYINEATRKTAIELRDRYQLHQVESGLLYMGLNLARPVSREEARYLLVTVTDLYIKNLNADPYLAEHCIDYPFSERNFDITLYFRDYRGGDSYHPNPSVAANDEGKIGYYYNMPRDRYSYAYKARESYDRAKAILAKSGCDGQAILHKDEPFYQTAFSVLTQYAKRMDKKRKLEYWGTGMGADSFAVRFSLYRPIRVEEARKMILEVTDELVADINASEELRPYLSHYPFTREDVEVGIYSHQKKTPSRGPELPTAPDIEVIASTGNEIVYEFRDLGAERHRTSETYDQAEQKLREGIDGDEIAEFAEHVSHLNAENSIENLMRRSSQGM